LATVITSKYKVMNRVDIKLNENDGKILYIIAGCNGAGKTTAFRERLSGLYHIPTFINADEIARRLCPSDVESVAFEAGRLMLQQIEEHIDKNDSFCIETTLSTRHYKSLISRAQAKGFKVALFFYWIDSPEFAVLRVASRHRAGGHTIPEDVIHRRYHRGIINLFSIYIPIVDYWRIDDNNGILPVKIAEGAKQVCNQLVFSKLQNYGK